MATKQDNYLRTHRKGSCLSQDELAFLLGSRRGWKVSTYELRQRRPPLETILAYEMIFGVPAKELFAGIHEKVEDETKRRAQELADKLATENPDPVTAQKLATLQQLVGSAADSHEEQLSTGPEH